MPKFRDNRPPGTISGEQARAMILTRCSVHLDADQWSAVAKRRGVRRIAGTRIFYDGQRVVRSAPLWCYVEADVKKQLSWIRRCDPRNLDIVPPSQLPTLEEIYREAAIVRRFRAMENQSISENERRGWEVPVVHVEMEQ